MTRLFSPLVKMGSMRSTVSLAILCANSVRIAIVIGFFRNGANVGCISRGLCFCDYLELGVIAQVFSPRLIEAALDACGARSVRRRDLSLEAMVYCVSAMGLFRQVSMREVLCIPADGLSLVAPGVPVRISRKSSVSRSRKGPGGFGRGQLRAHRARGSQTTAELGCRFPLIRTLSRRPSTRRSSGSEMSARCPREFRMPLQTLA